MNLNEVPRPVINSVSEFPSEFRGRLLKLALAANQSSYLNTNGAKIIDKFSLDSGIPKDHLYEVLGVYINIVKLFLEVKDKEFNERLMDIGFSNNFIESLPLITNRQEIENNFSKANVDYGKLALLKWRIDISLCNNSDLMKKVPLSVIITVKLKDGQTYTMEVDARQFHKLRFNVASILKELISLKTNYKSVQQ